jgi:hypothetical protein
MLIVIFWHESRRGSQYKIGMSAAEVRSQCGGKYPLQHLAVGFDQPPTPKERSEAIMYYIYDDQSGVMLYFNDYQILVKKTRLKYFGVNVPKLLELFR